MAKGTRRSTKRRAIVPSDRTLRSMTRENAPSSDATAESLMPRTNVMSLPNETLVFVAQYCEEKELWALCLASRRLNNVATSILWRGLYNDPFRCKEVLLWAIGVGRNDLVEELLNRKVSPNFLYFSSLLGSRLRDVLEAQGRRGAVGPRDDRTLHEEIFREKYCRSALVRNRVRRARKRAGLSLQITADSEDMDWNLAHAWFDHTCSLNHFGVSERQETNDRQYWYWAPIHVAVMRKNNTALRMLLDNQADIHVQCSGLCDCAAPAMDGQDDLGALVAPHRNRSVWTALHVAMCSGNEEAVRLLLSRRISISVGSLIRQPYSPHHKSRLAISAFQDAAWLGSVRMCKILVNDAWAQHFINMSNRRDQCALTYAAAGGHIRTVGKFLLENGASFQNYEGEPPQNPLATGSYIRFDVLRQLCTMQNYRDAGWLVRFSKQHYPDKVATGLYTRALASLCVLQKPAVFSRLSLRQQQDRCYDLTPDKINEIRASHEQAITRSQRQRVSLARTLLELGAKPNQPERVCCDTLPIVGPSPNSWGYNYRTPLQLAAMSGFTGMAKLLIAHGADPNKTATREENSKIVNPLRELPLTLAVDSALGVAMSGKDDISLVQTLLKHDGSVADRDDRSFLLLMQRIRNRHPVHPAVEKVWVRIAKELFRHGAATATKDSHWELFVRKACVPGGLAVCKLVEEVRPIRAFSFSTHVEMVRQAIFGVLKREPEGSPEDLELVYWALRQSLSCGGDEVRRRFKEAFLDFAAEARLRGKEDVAGVVQEFVTEMLTPREASPELGSPELQSETVSEKRAA